MKKFIVLTCLGLAMAISVPVLAGTQQEKMKACTQEAKHGGLKGDERKAFMSKCLKKDYVLKSASAESAHKPDKASKPDK
jgi:hypothetical protein